MKQLLVFRLCQQIKSFLLDSLIMSVSFSSFASVQVQFWYFDRTHWLRESQQKYNTMSENQTLSMVSNDTDNRPIMENTEFRQHSVADESIIVNDLHQKPRQARENALIFLQGYSKIEDTFPISRLKQSDELSIKFYKESTYYGEVHNGKKHGLGILVYKTSRVYEGEWLQDQKKGYGAEKFPNGCLYKGNYLNGKPSGTGTYIWPHGQRYDGQWLNGFKHGSGMWRGHRGDSYTGQWKFNKPEGYGVHTFPNGDHYEGQFKECLKHGQGIERFANGDMYKGRYENGKPSGYGEYYWYNGSFFKGKFVNGLRNGQGMWKRGVGHSDHYEGAYSNDKKWGYGVYTWATGNVYKGNYEADTRNGYGEMYWINGSYYKGNWVNGIQHGEGCIYMPTEGFKRGLFNNNVIVEVWEEKLVQKHQTSKPRLRIKTEQHPKGLKPKNMTFTSKYQGKKKHPSHQNLRIRTSAPRPNKSKKQQQSAVKVIERQRLSHQYNKVHQNNAEEKQTHFFSAKHTSMPRKRIHTVLNYDSEQKQKQSEVSVQHSSKERLLHSSFYLYKLNSRHNMDTLKHLRKRYVDQSSKGAILFMGKLFPEETGQRRVD